MADARQPSRGLLLVAWSAAALFVVSLLYFVYSYLVRFDTVDSTGHSGAIAAARNVTLFSVFALHHSITARDAAKAQLQRLIPPVLERSVYTLTSSILFLLVCALWRPLPGELYRLDGLPALAGHLVQGAGVILTIRSARRLGVLDLAGVSQVLDARHGFPSAPGSLETHGVYGFVRHPLYFAWVLMMFGTPDMTVTRLVFAAVSSAYLAIAIPFEERSLIRKFGAAYRDYQKRVRWRMVPGVY